MLVTGHVLRQCKVKKRVKDSQYFKDKMLLMEAKEKGAVLDAEAEAFLIDVDCTAPYDQPLAITTTNIFEVSHEDAYDSDVDGGPHAAAAFMTNLSSISGTNGATTSHVNEYQIDSKVQDVPTEVSSVSPGKISMITILDDLRNQLDGHLKVNQEQSMVNDSLRAELARCNLEIQTLERNKVYWLPAEELATQKSNPPKLVTPFVHTRPAPSKGNSKVIELEAEILKLQQMLAESDKQCSFIQKNHIDLQIKFRNYKEFLKNQTIGDNSHSPAVNAVFEINQLKEQLQGKDDTIRKLQTQINNMSILNVEPTVENVNLKQRYKELSTSNSHSRDTLTRKLTALTAENAKLKTESLSKMHSEPIVPKKPKVLALGMYAISSKYIVPPQRVNRAEPTPLPKKKQDTFQEPPRPSNRPTKKTVVQQNKKPNIHVNLSTGVKPSTRASKPMSKSDTQNHSTLSAKRAKARIVEDHHRNLNKHNHVDSRLNVKRTGFVSNSNTVCNACNESLVFANRDNCVVCNLKSVNVKTLTAMHNVKTTKNVWKSKVVTIRSKWKPTGRRFTLYDEYPLTRILEPIIEPLELTPCDMFLFSAGSSNCPLQSLVMVTTNWETLSFPESTTLKELQESINE
nr:hypothetical protein [Tanacetum cinerariifolium]